MRRATRFTDAISRAVRRRGVAIVGVCNVTPDSFSDGGAYLDLARAIERIEALVREGADIVDIGGESTRPGAARVPADVQIARVLRVVEHAAKIAVVSIDTTSPEVALACLDRGASCVNDVCCLADEEIAKVAAANGAALVLMHARGTQGEMKGPGGVPEQTYDDVVVDVMADWDRARNRAVSLGVSPEAIVMDPGLGFFKTARHSMQLLRRTDEIVRLAGVPVLVGASRKSFLGVVDPDAAPAERTGASVMAAVHAARAGASAVRVHDVRATRQALDLDIVLRTRGHGDRT